jgi:hypothetical protein
MQPTTRFHDGSANTVSQEAHLVFDHTVTFHPAKRVFDTDAARRDGTIGRFLQWRECSASGFFHGLHDRDSLARVALEAHLLIETTPPWEGRAFQISQAFIMRLPFIRRTQEADMTGLIDHEEVFERMALLLAAGVVLLVLGIGRSVDRSLSTIMPKRGDTGTSSVR